MMNWTTLLKFRRQVEDLAREAVVLVEWEKSQEMAYMDDIHRELDGVAFDLDRHLRAGCDTMVAEEGYQSLDRLQEQLETRVGRLDVLEQQLKELRQKLKKAYQARRVVELVIAKKEEEWLKGLAKREQQLHDEIAAHAYSMRGYENIS
jgi:flagellar biosynthesis chaperone FliJ